ncbi:mucin-4 [Procambarus clarkii]|uniref:mucin-4 n=1 Tax=Procambarus clarkii TaxID=6728 RepID=UPI001E6789DC|nr:mucin-12-like [Procambarus clarkii]
MAFRMQQSFHQVLFALLTMLGSPASLADSSHSNPSAVLGWASPRQPLEASSLPEQQLPDRLRSEHPERPVIPDGLKRFQFYVYGVDRQLVQKWISLQEIQDLLFELGPLGEGSACVNFQFQTGGELTPISQPRPSLPSRPEDSIQGVISTVQQVVSSEVAQNHQQPTNFPADLTQPSGESMEIPEAILQNLLSFPHHLTTPWPSPSTVTPVTDVPSTLPQTAYTGSPRDQPVTTVFPSAFTQASTTGSPRNQSATTTTATTITTTITPEASTTLQDIITREVFVTEAPDGVDQTTNRPNNNRWNSRFPGWNEQSLEVEEGESSTRHDLYLTDDYHSRPGGLSETVIPNDVTSNSLNVWNYIGNASGDAQDSSGMTTLSAGEVEEDSSTVSAFTTNNPLQVTITTEENSNLLTTKLDRGDPLLLTLTDLYAQSYSSDESPQPTSLTTTVNGPVREATAIQHRVETNASTLSPFQSAFMDFATNIFLEDSETTHMSEPPITETLKDTQTTSSIRTQPPPFVASVYSATERATEIPTIDETTQKIPTLKQHLRATTLPSASHRINTPEGPMALTQPDYNNLTPATNAPSRTTISLDNDNVLSIDLRNPSSPDSPYDIIPVEGQVPASSTQAPNSLTASQQDRPLRPYEGPGSFLEVRPEPNSPDSPQNEFSLSIQEALRNLTEDGIPQPTPSLLSTQTQNLVNNVLGIRNTLTQDLTTTQEPSLDDSTKQQPPILGITAQFDFTNEPNTQDSTQPPAATRYPSITSFTPLRPRPSLADQDLPRPAPLPNSSDTNYIDSSASDSNVLPPSQLADSGYQDRIDLEALEVNNGNLTEGDNFYDYYGSPVYLDNIPEDYYNYDVMQEKRPTLNSTDKLDFPGPNATSPYHDHHHDDHHHDDHHHHHHGDHGDHGGPPEPTATLLKAPEDNPGLEASVEGLHPDVREFVNVMNDITFKVYKQAASQHKRRNFVMSPLSLISTLGMLLLGARGSSSGALSDLLQMDKFYTFNPHLILKNVTQAVQEMEDIHDVALLSQFLVEKERNPYSTDFFARTIKVFYDAVIEDADPADLDATVRQRVNDLIRNRTKGRVDEFLLENEPLFLTPPLTAVATSFFHARWSLPVLQQELVDMHFIRFPTAERRLIRTVGLRKKMTLNAGFSRAAGVTSAEIPLYSTSGELSLVLAMPGEQKNFIANGLAQLESTLNPEKWSQVLRSMLPNTVQLKMPVFRHRAFHNFSSILGGLGLGQLFQEGKADFSGINHVKNLHLSDVVQLTEFQSCQVESPPLSRAIRSRRSPSEESDSDEEESDSDEEEEAEDSRTLYQPTYIYGFPMVEYLQLDKMKLTRMDPEGGHYDEIFSKYFPRQVSPTKSSLTQASSTDTSKRKAPSTGIKTQQISSTGNSQHQGSTGNNFQQEASLLVSPQETIPENHLPQQASSTDKPSHHTSSTESSHHTSSTESLQQAVSTESSQQGVSTESSQQAVSTESSQQAVSTESSQQAVSTESSQQAVSTESSQQAVSTESSQQAVSTKSSQQTYSTDNSQELSSTKKNLTEKTSQTDNSPQLTPSKDNSTQETFTLTSPLQQKSSNSSLPQHTSHKDSSAQQTTPANTTKQKSSQQTTSIHNSTQHATSPNNFPQQKNLTSQKTTKTQMESENILPASPKYQYYKNDFEKSSVYLGSEDYRIDRMGLPAASDDTKRPSGGAFYRQSDVGTLAFDRAFLYAVRHNPTGLLLFIGRYLDPEGN